LSSANLKTIASTAFTVMDTTPPVVSIVLPQAGTTYTSTITILALATDNASGVERLEYQLDAGDWNLMPPADPISGSYGVTWNPTAVDNGVHTIRLKATDRSQNTSAPVSVTITCQSPPEDPVDFTALPLVGNVPFLVSFTDLSVHTPIIWSWDFGDNSDSSVQNPFHIYRQEGTYTVSLTATGSGGTSLLSKTGYVTASPCPVKPARIKGPEYFTSLNTAQANLGTNNRIDLQAVIFTEDVEFSFSGTVTLTGGYTCDYGTRIGESLLDGSLTLGSGSGAVIVDGIAVH
jgi:PKD repeat protein